MPDQQCYIFRNLPPGEMLGLLADLAQETRGQGIAGVSFSKSEMADLAGGLDLIWVDPETIRPTPADKQDRRQALTVARGLYRKLTGGIDVQPGQAEAGQPIDTIGSLLLSTARQGEQAERLPDQLMFVGSKKTDDQIVSFLERIELAATGVRMALPRAADRVCLVHVLDDPARRGGVRALLSGQMMPGWTALDAVTDGQSIVFLPPDIIPSSEWLARFCRLVRHAPGVFAGPIATPGPASELLFAVTGSPLQQSFLLSHLTFSRPVAPVPEELACEHVRLADSSAAVRELARRVAEAQPEWGYRLDLRDVELYTDDGLIQARMERMTEHIARLENELVNLESQSAPRPHLLRFSQRQLPALADYLRGFPQRVLKEAKLFYAYQAYSFDPDAGAHYLYVPPTAGARLEIDPIQLWRHLDAPNMHFWLDPFWAYHYAGPNSASEVFVPQGMALFPAMHDWGPESMDLYLRENAARWFHGQLTTADIPARPIYLFDRHASDGSAISLQVLDRQVFVPLSERLAWMNDNLIPLHARRDAGDFWQKLSKDAERHRLASEIAQLADTTSERFAEVARRTSETIAAETDDLTAALTGELDALHRDALETSQRIAEFRERLARLVAILNAASAQEQRTQSLISSAESDLQSLNAHNLKLAGDVEQAIEQARNDRTLYVGAIEVEIRALADAVGRLQQEFRSTFGF